MSISVSAMSPATFLACWVTRRAFGSWYCPMMPKDLVNASADVRAGSAPLQ